MGSFGKRIYELRVNTKNEDGTGCLSQEEFGKTIGLSRNSIYNYETDKRKPGIDDLLVISKTYSVSLDWLLKGAECKSADNEEIHKRLGLSDGAIAKLETWHDRRNLVIVTDNSTLYSGEPSDDFLKEDNGTKKIVIHDYKVQAINTLIEDDGKIINLFEQFFFYKFHPADKANSPFELQTQDGIHVFLDPVDINNISLVGIQKELLKLREKILRKGADDGEHQEN